MGRRLHYRMGSFYRVSDRSGFAERAEDTRSEWNGLIVAKREWEIRQPQDLVKGVKDDQSVPDARPLAPNIYVGPISVATTANAVVGQTNIPVQSVAGFFQGAEIGVMLDIGVVFLTTVAVQPAAAVLVLSAGLPFTVASGNLVTLYKPSPPVANGLP